MQNRASPILFSLVLIASLTGCSKPYQQRNLDVMAVDGERLLLFVAERSGTQTEMMGACPRTVHHVKRQRIYRIAYSLSDDRAEPEVRLLLDESSDNETKPTLNLWDLRLPEANTRMQRPFFVRDDEIPVQTRVQLKRTARGEPIRWTAAPSLHPVLFFGTDLSGRAIVCSEDQQIRSETRVVKKSVLDRSLWDPRNQRVLFLNVNNNAAFIPSAPIQGAVWNYGDDTTRVISFTPVTEQILRAAPNAESKPELQGPKESLDAPRSFFDRLGLPGVQATTEQEQRYESYYQRIKRSASGALQAIETIDVSDGADEFEAWALATAYTVSYIRGGAYAEMVVDSGDVWTSKPTSDDLKGGRPTIFVSKQTGAVWAADRPRVDDPRHFTELSTSWRSR